MSTKLIINTDYCLGRFKTRYHKAQIFVDNEVVKDCEPYVPFRSGELARSGQRATTPGSGQVIYDAKHANPQYRNYPNKSKVKHPQATMTWFESAKAVCKEKWVKGARKIVTGG